MSSPTNKEGENRLDPPPRASTASGSGDLVSEIQNVECFNAVTDWQFALTSGMRDAPTTSLDSEMDDPEVIVTVAFNQIVSLKSLSIHGKPGEERQSAPRTVKVFANKPNYQFDDCSNKKPTQKIVVGETECVFGGETIELDQVRDVILRARRRRKASTTRTGNRRRKHVSNPWTEEEDARQYSIDRARRGDIFSAMIGARISL